VYIEYETVSETCITDQRVDSSHGLVRCPYAKKRLSLCKKTYIRKIILIYIGTDANDCIGTDVFLREHRRWGDVVGDMSSLLMKKCIGTDAKIHKDRHMYYIRTHVNATLSS
jgi:hypothetical protein